MAWKFCESLREHAIKIIFFEKKKIRSLTKEQQESYENAKICYVCKEKFENKYVRDKAYCKVKDHDNYTGYGIYNLEYSIPKKIPVVFIIDLTTIIILS